MKVTIITPIFNANNYLKDCISSIISQNYNNIEYIVIDGSSDDGSISIIESYKAHISYFLSEKDQGIYDAINKGLQMATGDIIGVLNADDYLAGEDVISALVSCFKRNDCDAVYGNLNYIKRNGLPKIIRKWKSGSFRLKDLEYGWMPAHPTFYIKRAVYKKLGPYALNFGTCGDYELMLRYLYKHQIRAVFLNKLLISMRAGGRSNGSFMKLFKGCVHDYRALRYNKIPHPMLTLILKRLRKLKQFYAQLHGVIIIFIHAFVLSDVINNLLCVMLRIKTS